VARVARKDLGHALLIREGRESVASLGDQKANGKVERKAEAEEEQEEVE
jgi:hypothetical protein